MTDLPSVWTNKTALRWGARSLQEMSGTPRLDAEVLLRFGTEQSRTDVLAHPDRRLNEGQRDRYRSLVTRRAHGEPIAYITGRKEFWSFEFLVTREVLIPRPETELLVEHALAYAARLPDPIRLVDLGTGSGCIAASVVFELRSKNRTVQAIALDSSEAALSVARENLERIVPDERIELLQSDWFAAVPPGYFDLVLSNPPYVAPEAEGLPRELAFEPPGALFAEESGIGAVCAIARSLPERLAPGGAFFCEIGFDQRTALQHALLSILPPVEFEIQFAPDLEGRDRLLICTRGIRALKEGGAEV